MIIGVVGKKQSGKDSLANIAMKLLPDKKIKKISFAKPLKDFVHDAFRIPKKNLWGSNEDKNYPLCTWSDIFTGPAINNYRKHDRALLSAREILQIVGTDVMRYGNLNYLNNKFLNEVELFLKKKLGAGTRPYSNIWVDLTMMDIKTIKARKEAEIVFITDARFHNETKAIRENSGKLIRLYRDTKCEDSIPHPSELEMEEMQDKSFDFVLYEEQNTNLKQLEVFVIKVLMDLGLIGTGGMVV